MAVGNDEFANDMGRHLVGPLPVSRGPKLHEAEIGLDWLRFTWERERLGELSDMLSEQLGDAELKRGLWSYGERLQYAYGASINFSGRDRRECCCDLPGEACRRLGHDVLLTWLRKAEECGHSASRIDIRADFRGERVGLIDRVLSSARAGELCGARRVKPDEPFDAITGELLGRQVSIGVRGKDGSGRYVRVYDKGLETGTESVGRWERWEAEFAKKVAAKVVAELLDAVDWVQAASQACLGAVDFREANGQRAYERRPRVDWWSALLDGLQPVMHRKEGRTATLSTYLIWMRRCVVPGLHALAGNVGFTEPQLLQFIGREPLCYEARGRYERMGVELVDELLRLRQLAAS